jgi:hypothetical protein
MKKLILLLICLIFFTISYSQKELKIGDSVIKPILVDSSKFNLYGTWKVIYRTYVAERENTYETPMMPQASQQTDENFRGVRVRDRNMFVTN